MSLLNAFFLASSFIAVHLIWLVRCRLAKGGVSWKSPSPASDRRSSAYCCRTTVLRWSIRTVTWLGFQSTYTPSSSQSTESHWAFRKNINWTWTYVQFRKQLLNPVTQAWARSWNSWNFYNMQLQRRVSQATTLLVQRKEDHCRKDAL